MTYSKISYQHTARQHRCIWRYHLVFLTLASLCLAASSATAQELSEVRATMHKQYDQDGSGRLDASERELMRAATKKSKTPRNRGRGQRFEPPKNWVHRYDADKDGELSSLEIRKAFESEMELMKKAYDKDGNGELDDKEKLAVKNDLQAQKFEGMDAWMAGRLSGAFDDRRRGGSEKKKSREEQWLEFDKNKDGRANARELQAIREYESKRNADRAKKSVAK